MESPDFLKASTYVAYYLPFPHICSVLCSFSVCCLCHISLPYHAQDFEYFTIDEKRERCDIFLENTFNTEDLHDSSKNVEDVRDIA